MVYFSTLTIFALA